MVRSLLLQYGPSLVELHLLGLRLGPAFILVATECTPSRERGEFVERKAEFLTGLVVRTPEFAKRAVVLRFGLPRRSIDGSVANLT